MILPLSFSTDNILDNLKSISTIAKNKFLSVFGYVKSSVDNILSDNKKTNSVVNSRKEVKNIQTKKLQTELQTESVEKVDEKLSGYYTYENTKGREFYLELKDNVILNIDSKDGKKFPVQQKTAIQRLLNNSKLGRFRKIDKEGVGNEVIEKEVVDSGVQAEIFDYVNSSEETIIRVKELLGKIVDANKRNRDMVEVFDKLKEYEVGLYSSNFSDRLNSAKQIIKLLSEIVPKSKEKKYEKIKVDGNLLDRVVNGISLYLEKNGLENLSAENARSSLVDMLGQAKYVLREKIAPSVNNVGNTYEAVYA